MKMTKALALSLAAAFTLSGHTALAEGSGEKLFKKKCGTCHSMNKGEHKVGPSLAGVIGRKAGSTDFSNYKALAGADFTWDVDNIKDWIADPKKFIGKPTAMTVKVKKEDERTAIIDYLMGKAD